MTDEQIIKALECCIKLNAEPNNFEICKKDCPYKFNCCDREKGTSVEKDILDLLNRQQSAIDVYMQENDRLKTAYIQVSMDRDEANAEIERLQEDSKRLKKVQMQLDDAMKMYSTIKAEVIKEYKEKLREHAYYDSGITGFQEMVVDLSDIENIADEMVGEGK